MFIPNSSFCSSGESPPRGHGGCVALLHSGHSGSAGFTSALRQGKLRISRESSLWNSPPASGEQPRQQGAETAAAMRSPVNRPRFQGSASVLCFCARAPAALLPSQAGAEKGAQPSRTAQHRHPAAPQRSGPTSRVKKGK